jgi:hypothetical protein
VLLERDNAHYQFLFLSDCRRTTAGNEPNLPDDNHARAGSFWRCPSRDSFMAYLLPRAILVVLAWGLTCALIRKFWPDANSVIFFLAAVSWAGAAGAYFGYLYKLHRDIEELERVRGYARRRPS